MRCNYVPDNSVTELFDWKSDGVEVHLPFRIKCDCQHIWEDMLLMRVEAQMGLQVVRLIERKTLFHHRRTCGHRLGKFLTRGFASRFLLSQKLSPCGRCGQFHLSFF